MVSGPSPGPAPAAQARASSSRLTRSSWRTWPHRKLRRNVPRVEGALTMHPSTEGGPSRTQRIGVVNAVAARQRRGHQRQHLVSRVRPPRRIREVEVTVNEFTQAHALGQGGRKEQPSIVDRAVVVEGVADTAGWLRGSICWVLLVSGRFPLSKTIIPDSEAHPFASSASLPHAAVR